MIPGFGGTFRLAVPSVPARAKELIYSGRRISSAEALELGIVLETFADQAAMLTAAQTRIEQLSPNSAVAIAAAKSVLVAQSGRETEEAREIEIAAFRTLFESADRVEGMSAFAEKRRPNF